jgi:hypothetical protein
MNIEILYYDNGSLIVKCNVISFYWVKYKVETEFQFEARNLNVMLLTCTLLISVIVPIISLDELIDNHE